MEYMLPDEDTMKKMAEEYAEINGRLRSAAETVREFERNIGPAASVSGFAHLFLLLYFTYILGYNSCYGSQIYDADGGLGRI